jgi:hypothetical protein
MAGQRRRIFRHWYLEYGNPDEIPAFCTWMCLCRESTGCAGRPRGMTAASQQIQPETQHRPLRLL